MRKIIVTMEELFNLFKMQEEQVEKLKHLEEDIYVNTPQDEWVRVRGLIRKIDKKIKVTTQSGVTFICGDKHIVLSSKGNVFVKDSPDVANILLGGFDKIIGIEYLEDGDLYDISIEAPHLYVTPNGVVHHNTSSAIALCEQLNLSYEKINCITDGSIDTIRDKITKIASTQSFKSPYKVIILDELGEGASAQFQPALKSFIETYHKNCRFIITTNHLNRIIDPLKSRCAIFEFNFTKEESKELKVAFFKRIKDILELENIQYDNALIVNLINKHYPDFRKTLVELQQNCVDGKLSGAVVNKLKGDEVNVLFELLKNKKWTDMRKWVVDNIDYDFELVLRAIYDNASDYLKLDSLPQLCLLLSQYNERMTRGVDKEITIVAMLTEILANCDFK